MGRKARVTAGRAHDARPAFFLVTAEQPFAVLVPLPVNLIKSAVR